MADGIGKLQGQRCVKTPATNSGMTKVQVGAVHMLENTRALYSGHVCLKQIPFEPGRENLAPSPLSFPISSK